MKFLYYFGWFWFNYLKVVGLPWQAVRCQPSQAIILSLQQDRGSPEIVSPTLWVCRSHLDTDMGNCSSWPCWTRVFGSGTLCCICIPPRKVYSSRQNLKLALSLAPERNGEENQKKMLKILRNKITLKSLYSEIKSL